MERSGSTFRVSAAHDVALQYGATIGVVGLVAWLLLFIGTGFVLLWFLQRGVVNVWLTASIAGAWTAYLAQSLVSIDMLQLKALGWLLSGLILALAMSAGPARDDYRGAAWRPVVAGVLALAAVAMWVPSLAAGARADSQGSAEGALNDVVDPLVPCRFRFDLLIALAQGADDLSTLMPAARQSLEMDPRCPLLAAPIADFALQAGDLELATKAAEIAVETDPLAPASWFVLSMVREGQGDDQGAQAALEEARRLDALEPASTLGSLLGEPG